MANQINKNPFIYTYKLQNLGYSDLKTHVRHRVCVKMFESLNNEKIQYQ